MRNIFIVETKKYLKSPTIVGYLLIPIIIFLLLSLLVNVLIAFTFTLMTQMLFISFFVYGSRLKDYNSDTMKKKMTNSENSKFYPIFINYILSNVILLISLMIPLVITLVMSDSVIKFYDKLQWSYWVGEIDVNSVIAQMKMGLPYDMLLFNATLLTFIQFGFALLIINTSIFAFATVLTSSISNSSMYFAISLSLFTILILFSGWTSKDIHVMADGQYTREVPIIQNKLFITLKLLNPFYWMNQLLMNTFIADQYSGTFIQDPTITGQYEAPGKFIPTYFNVFHVGTDFSMVQGDAIEELGRSIYTNEIELYQIMSFTGPLIFGSSMVTSFVLMEVI